MSTTNIDYITQTKTNSSVKKLEQFLADENLKAEIKSPYSNIIDQGLGRTFTMPFKHSKLNQDLGSAQDYDQLVQMTSTYGGYQVRNTKTKIDMFFELLEAARLSGAIMNFAEKQFFTIPGVQQVRNYDDIDYGLTTKKSAKMIEESNRPPQLEDDPESIYEPPEIDENPFANIENMVHTDEEEQENDQENDETSNGLIELGDTTGAQMATVDEEEKYDREFTHSGIMLDFDIFQKKNERQFRHTQYYQFVYDIAGILNEILDWKEYADTNDGNVNVWVGFIAKPEVVPIVHPKYGDCYKDGFHVLIPGVQVTKNVKRYIIHLINERGMLNDTFRGCEFLNPINELLDVNSRSVPVLFLGNAKRGKQPYVFECLYHVALRLNNKMPVVQGRNDFDPIPEIGGPNRKVPDPRDRRKKIDMKAPERFKYNLCHELSLCYEAPGGLIKKLKFECIPSLKADIDAFCERRSGEILKDSELRDTANKVTELSVRNSEAAYLQQVLNIISQDRVREYDSWKGVIIMLARRSQEYKPLAAWFSQRFPTSYANNAMSVIDSLFDWVAKNKPDENDPAVRRVRSVGTLYDWAKHDNPKKYEEIQNLNAFMLLQKLILKNDGALNDANLAKVLWTMFRNKFVFALNPLATTKNKQGEWYEFVLPTDNLGRNSSAIYKYRKELYPYTLDSYINEKLPEFIAQVREWVQERRDAQDADEEWQKYYDAVYKKLKQTSQTLGNAGKSTAIISKCENEFLDRGFIEQLDTNKHILGVGNGVLRLFPQTELIQQYHDIPISRYTDVDYIPYDPRNPFIAETEKAIRDLFYNEDGPETDAFEFTMMYLASTLDARSKIPLLYIWLGEGGNGKSFLLELHINTLRLVPIGGYGAKLGVEFLTTHRPAANASNPAMMVLKSARFVYFSESEKGDVLRMGNIKEITSETLSARNHHESQDNFRANCHFVFASNNDPRVGGSDHGTWRRIIVYRFKMKFVPNPDPANWQERKQDSKWIDYAPSSLQYRRAYLSILVHWYGIYREKYNSNLHQIPKPTIDRETSEYRKEQDTMHRFLEEKVIRIGPGSGDAPTEKIPLAEVARAYIKWYQSKIDDIRISDVEVIKDLKSSKLKRWIEEKYKEFMLTEHIILKANEWWDAQNKQILINPSSGNPTSGPLTADQVNWKAAGKSKKVIDDLDIDDEESIMEPSTVPSPKKDNKKVNSPPKSTTSVSSKTNANNKTSSKAKPAVTKKTSLKPNEKKGQDNIVIVDDLDDVYIEEDFVDMDDDLE
jgi:phage/plasmid-associated DNA primase